MQNAKTTFKSKNDIQKQRQHSKTKMTFKSKDDIQKQRRHSKCKDDIKNAKTTFKTFPQINLSYICRGYFVCVCLCACVCVSQLTIAESSGYYLCYSDPTDQGGHTEGLERQGLY